uniref:ATP synthase mitochondrial F1 complex assembly factor 2 n=1 Tax=Plectus sambesii TaxID=2011161 RepID=A0A914X9U7_9BILA
MRTSRRPHAAPHTDLALATADRTVRRRLARWSRLLSIEPNVDVDRVTTRGRALNDAAARAQAAVVAAASTAIIRRWAANTQPDSQRPPGLASSRCVALATRRHRRSYRRLDKIINCSWLQRRSFLSLPVFLLPILPSEALALAIAQEWDAQKKTLRMDHMRLTGLAFTAIDNPLRLDTPTIIKQIIDYLETDTVFFMASEPDKLVELQKLHWGELLKWSNETFGLDVRPTESILAGPVISEQSRLMMERHLASYDRWALTGYQYAVEAVKSLIIILATVAHRLSVEEAVRIAALEQLFQTETWGKVEWAHDIEHHDLCSRVAAGVLFVHLTSNRESTTKTIARA